MYELVHKLLCYCLWQIHVSWVFLSVGVVSVSYHHDAVVPLREKRVSIETRRRAAMRHLASHGEGAVLGGRPIRPRAIKLCARSRTSTAVLVLESDGYRGICEGFCDAHFPSGLDPPRLI